MKNLRLVKLIKSNLSKLQIKNCKTLKNTNSIVNHVTLVFYSRTPTISIVKQNNVRQSLLKRIEKLIHQQRVADGKKAA